MNRKKLQPLTRGRRVVVVIMGAVFLSAGLALFIGLVLGSLYGYWRTRVEVTVEAQLKSVELRRASNGPRGGTSRSTEATYDYRVGDKTFSGSKLTLFHQSAEYYPPLSAAFRAGRPIRVFVDPDEPQFSVMDRSFTWWPFAVAVPFSLAFVIAGGFLLWASWRAPAAGRAEGWGGVME